MGIQVDLRVTLDRNRPFEEGCASAATANNAVPLMWLGLFDYEDVAIEQINERTHFVAQIEAAKAVERAKALREAIPTGETVLVDAANRLRRAAKKSPEGSFVVLCPRALLETMRPRDARAYVQGMVQLCDLWQRFRDGESWDKVRAHLETVQPAAFASSQAREASTACYLWVGSAAYEEEDLDEFLIAEGQGEKDVEPEALAVGEQGLLLGRFGGVWKLLCSGSNEDLHAVWGCKDVAYIVGGRGTLLCLQGGESKPVELPTDRHLYGVWGLSNKSVCVVGGGGTMLAFNGEQWRPWPVPSEANLHSVWGTAVEDIHVAGEESFVLRYDGVSWNRIALPVEGMINTLFGSDEVTYGAGGSRRGGELFRFGREGWTSEQLPAAPWFVGSFSGWDDELGLFSDVGEGMVRKKGTWQLEQAPVEQVVAVGGGAVAMLAGTCRGYSVIAVRGESGWEIEASLVGLRIEGLWVAGSPKPPRLPPLVSANDGQPAEGEA